MGKRKKLRSIFIDPEDRTLDMISDREYDYSCYICPQYQDDDACESFPQGVPQKIQDGGICEIQQNLVQGYTIKSQTHGGGVSVDFIPEPEEEINGTESDGIKYCLTCKHWISFLPKRWRGRCKAYPDLIPKEYAKGLKKHTEVMEDQEGYYLYERETGIIGIDDIVKEDLPLPYVVYPNLYGTFIAFSDSELGELFICECTKKAVNAYFEYWRKFPRINNADKLRRAALSSEYWPVLLAHKSTVEKPHPLEWLKYKPDLCHKCNHVIPAMRYCAPMYGNNFIQRYGWYVNQRDLEQSKAIDLGKQYKKVEQELRDELGFRKYKGDWIIKE